MNYTLKLDPQHKAHATLAEQLPKSNQAFPHLSQSGVRIVINQEQTLHIK
jgi:hypothetical protein